MSSFLHILACHIHFLTLVGILVYSFIHTLNIITNQPNHDTIPDSISSYSSCPSSYNSRSHFYFLISLLHAMHTKVSPLLQNIHSPLPCRQSILNYITSRTHRHAKRKFIMIGRKIYDYYPFIHTYLHSMCIFSFILIYLS